jgi:hypothetical protein
MMDKMRQIFCITNGISTDFFRGIAIVYNIETWDNYESAFKMSELNKYVLVL